MTIRPGSEWGESVPMPLNALIIDSDASLAEAITRGETRPLLVRGGDLHVTMGAPTSTSSVTKARIDAIWVRADGREALAVAHVVARGRGRLGWWRGPVVAVMNVDHLGPWDVAPRAHPNDGRLDVVETSSFLSVRERWQASKRLPTGTHVPHPGITMRRPTTASFEFDRPRVVQVDGREWADVRAFTATVEPDAAIVYF